MNDLVRTELRKKSILRFVYPTLLTIFIILLLTLIISGRSLPIPYRFFAVQTGSMKPIIEPGDFIIVEKQDNYKVGDIIAFNSGSGESEKVITHRIVESEDEDTLFTTKGDFNSVKDVDKVGKADIVGKYQY